MFYQFLIDKHATPNLDVPKIPHQLTSFRLSNAKQWRQYPFPSFAQGDFRHAHSKAAKSTVRLRSPSLNWGVGWVAKIGSSKVIITNNDVATEGHKFPWNLAIKREYRVEYYGSKVAQTARPVLRSEELDLVVMELTSGQIPVPALHTNERGLRRGESVALVAHLPELTGSKEQENRAYINRLLGPRVGTSKARYLSFISNEGIVAGAIASKKGRCGGGRACVLLSGQFESGTSGAVFVTEDGTAAGMSYGFWPGTKLIVGLDSRALHHALRQFEIELKNRRQ